MFCDQAIEIPVQCSENGFAIPVFLVLFDQVLMQVYAQFIILDSGEFYTPRREGHHAH